ncbi:MAG: succinate dehydrogenase [Hyphomicrobiales bacterium]|nr:succinate dehydrogenase [Hyphomicrobiales bacterium]MDE2114478.1 succinate dehydrogenase [Hyphomicrobiales bacterium]
MNAALFLAQRVTAVILAFAVTIHLTTILYAARQGLTAQHILQRTHGNWAFLTLYSVFVVAAAIHGPIGLRNILREWLGWWGSRVDSLLIAFALLLIVLGLRAAYGVFVS